MHLLCILSVRRRCRRRCMHAPPRSHPHQRQLRSLRPGNTNSSSSERQPPQMTMTQRTPPQHACHIRPHAVCSGPITSAHPCTRGPECTPRARTYQHHGHEARTHAETGRLRTEAFRHEILTQPYRPSVQPFWTQQAEQPFRAQTVPRALSARAMHRHPPPTRVDAGPARRGPLAIAEVPQ